MGIFTKTAGFFKDRLGKTRAKISSSLATVLSLGRKIDEDMLDELEETLLSDDIGVETTDKLISELREAYRDRQIATSDDVIPFLKEHMKSYWPDRDRQLHPPTTGPTVILVAGVNARAKPRASPSSRTFSAKVVRRSSSPPAIRSAPPQSSS